jgi:hypothetical protein
VEENFGVHTQIPLQNAIGTLEDIAKQSSEFEGAIREVIGILKTENPQKPNYKFGD